jgi:hypothetical protein
MLYLIVNVRAVPGAPAMTRVPPNPRAARLQWPCALPTAARRRILSDFSISAFLQFAFIITPPGSVRTAKMIISSPQNHDHLELLEHLEFRAQLHFRIFAPGHGRKNPLIARRARSRRARAHREEPRASTRAALPRDHASLRNNPDQQFLRSVSKNLVAKYLANQPSVKPIPEPRAAPTRSALLAASPPGTRSPLSAPTPNFSPLPRWSIDTLKPYMGPAI